MGALGLGLRLVDYVVDLLHAAHHVGVVDQLLVLEVGVRLVVDPQVDRWGRGVPERRGKRGVYVAGVVHVVAL